MSDIINFDNKQYVWEEISGKGKCLVPYVEANPFDILNNLDIFHGKYIFKVTYNHTKNSTYCQIVRSKHGYTLVGMDGHPMFTFDEIKDKKQFIEEMWCLAKSNRYSVKVLPIDVLTIKE